MNGNLKNWMVRAGLTPAKAVLVAALAALLVAVLLWQSTGEAPPLSRRRPRAEARQGQRPPRKFSGKIDESAWAPPEVSDIQFDPFARPARELTLADVAPAAEDSARDGQEPGDAGLEELRRLGVSVVFERRGRRAAVIGEEILSVGDQIGDFRIVSIDDRGVSIQRRRPTQ